MTANREFIGSVLELLELLVVSLDRISQCEDSKIELELLQFVKSRAVLEQLAVLRTQGWQIAEELFSDEQIREIEKDLETLPYWSSR